MDADAACGGLAADARPLLDLEGGADAAWERIEAEPARGGRLPPALSVRELIRADPASVVERIKAGVVKVLGVVGVGGGGLVCGGVLLVALRCMGLLRLWWGDGDQRRSTYRRQRKPKHTHTHTHTHTQPTTHARTRCLQLGEFEVDDAVLLRALRGAPMLTMGAASASIDFEAAWRARLAPFEAAAAAEAARDAKAAGATASDAQRRPRRRRRGGGGAFADGGGWSRPVVVEAFVVNIRGAAAPDAAGLVQPLLRRWQAGGCHYSVFALPAVEAVLEFKWTR